MPETRSRYRVRARSSLWSRPTPRCSPASARRSPGASRRAWPGLALAARTSPATCSSRFSTANPGGLTSGDPNPNAAKDEAKDKAQAYDQLTFIPWNNLDPFFEAVVQSTEEAVLNSLVANEDMTGRDGHRTPALPRDRLAAIVQASNTRG